jgi:Putative polyhydroxyalkanoic acid system protein (PHA_gran_rgn)
MASYSVLVPHDLGQTTARARVERFLDDVQRDYAAHVSDVWGKWTENCLQFDFDVSGLAVSGMLVVEESSVHVSGPLPLAAALFRGRIEQTIRDELRRLLS